MFASLAIKIVEKLFDHAMQERDGEKIRLHEHNRMLTNRARLTNLDELILSYIERGAPFAFEKLANKFEDKVDCIAKRLSVFVAYGFINIKNNIISLDEKYKPIAADITVNSMDETVMFQLKDTDHYQRIR